MRYQYVLHITKWYPNKDDDLEGVFIQRQIESIQQHYSSVVFYARASSKINQGKLVLINEVHADRNSTYTAYYNQNITGISILDKGIKSILYFFIMQSLLRKAITKFGKPAIIHAHVLLRPALIAWWFSIKLRVPYLISEHSTYFTAGKETYRWSIKNQIRRLLVKQAKAIITVSCDLEQGMKYFKLENNNYFRLFNCVNTKVFNYQIKIKTKITNLLHVSEFKNEHKNIIGILEVIKNLKRNDFHFMLHLVGYGQDLDAVLAFINDHDLNDCIKYYGKLFDKQLAELYKNSDGFLLFSNKENMPCVIAESLCCGTPVISTNAGGISEVIHPNNGMLIEIGNHNQLYEAIVKIIENNHHFNSQKISSEALQLFSFESIGINLAKIYQSCQGSK